jgi:hypothetical protein
LLDLFFVPDAANTLEELVAAIIHSGIPKTCNEPVLPLAMTDDKKKKSSSQEEIIYRS